MVMAELIADLLPPSVLNIVNGFGREAGMPQASSKRIFFEDIAAADDDLFDKAIEGLVLFAFNQGDVCTCPSRALIQESIYDKFMARALERIKAIKQGHPLDTETMMGTQASAQQMDKILSYMEVGKHEGAQCLIGGTGRISAASWPAATTCSPRSSRATTRCACSAKRSLARCWP